MRSARLAGKGLHDPKRLADAEIQTAVRIGAGAFRQAREVDMANVTYYVAMPFIRDDGGDLVPGEAQGRQTANAAILAAAKMAMDCAGAVAFSRTGDSATGKFGDAVVIQSFGDVPQWRIC